MILQIMLEIIGDLLDAAFAWMHRND